MTALIDAAGRIIIEAGLAILQVYDTDFQVDTKDDASPITEADRRAHRIIREGLSNIDIPEYRHLPVLSEEGLHTPYPERKAWKRYWLVDPLDGTKEFVHRNGEFTVNIALIEDGLPEAGLVYVPVTDMLYIGTVGEGACRIENASRTDRRGGIVRLPDTRRDEKRRREVLTIAASRSHLNEATKQYIETVQPRLGRRVETVRAGSSLKLCRIAEGSADLYPRFGPTMEWDTAAAHAVCRAAGASVTDVETGEEMRYNKEDLRNHHFIAAPAEEISALLP